jgi:hypothetical protein
MIGADEEPLRQQADGWDGEDAATSLASAKREISFQVSTGFQVSGNLELAHRL